MTDLIGLIGPLAGVAVGALVTRGTGRDTWRRDQRTRAYTDLLHQAHDLIDTMRHGAWQSEQNYTGPLDWAQLQDVLRPLRQAALTTELFGGNVVRVATSEVLHEASKWTDVDPTGVDLLEFSRAVDTLGDAMRLELDPPRSLRQRRRWRGL